MSASIESMAKRYHKDGESEKSYEELLGICFTCWRYEVRVYDIMGMSMASLGEVATCGLSGGWDIIWVYRGINVIPFA